MGDCFVLIFYYYFSSVTSARFFLHDYFCILLATETIKTYRSERTFILLYYTGLLLFYLAYSSDFILFF